MKLLLSDVQKKAVFTTEGPVLVFAGAGSGKTRVITYRIAYLIKEKHVPPENILAVTFTNKAAKEMKARIASLVEDDTVLRHITVSTFHSLGLRILKTEHQKIGYPANFVIYTPYEQVELLKKIMDERGISRERFSPSSTLSILSAYKNDSSLRDDKTLNTNPKYRVAKELYPFFNDALKVAGAMDFDDLIIKVNELFEANPDIRKKYASKYRYVMVDEYQDTNTSQYKIIRHIASVHGNICVVGDDDQSIYSWRGAKVENILNFEKDFEGCTVVKLEENYRSIDTIVEAASSLIQKNRVRANKTVFTSNSAADGEGINIIDCDDEKDEAERIAQIIDDYTAEELDYKDMSILIRANHQSAAFEFAFRKNRIPYKIIGGKKFFENKEIKDLVAYIRILAHPRDEISLRRVINYPTRGIGTTCQEKLFETADKKRTNPLDIIKNIESYSDPFKPQQFNSLDKFAALYNSLVRDMEKESPLKFGQILVEKISLKSQVVKSAENETVAKIKLDNINEFINLISVHHDSMDEKLYGVDFFADFINSVSLVQNGEEENSDNAVTIITAHSAKGLEFNTVFLAGFYEGGFPNIRAITEGNVEEERRLAYVAFTRAEKRLIITVPAEVRRFGKRELVTPSRFIEESDIVDKRYTSMPEYESVADFLGKIIERD